MAQSSYSKAGVIKGDLVELSNQLVFDVNHGGSKAGGISGTGFPRPSVAGDATSFPKILGVDVGRASGGRRELSTEAQPETKEKESRKRNYGDDDSGTVEPMPRII